MTILPIGGVAVKIRDGFAFFFTPDRVRGQVRNELSVSPEFPQNPAKKGLNYLHHFGAEHQEGLRWGG